MLEIYQRGQAKGEGIDLAIARVRAHEARWAPIESNPAHRQTRKHCENTILRLEKYRTGEIAIDSNLLHGAWVNRDEGGSVSSRLLDAWRVRLIEHGRRLDYGADRVLGSVIPLPFHAWGPKGRLSSLLAELMAGWEAIRSFEVDVEDYLLTVTEHPNYSPDVLPLVQTLNQLQRTYDRAYDLCTFKVTSISTTRATWASIGLAVVAAVVAIVGVVVGSEQGVSF